MVASSSAYAKYCTLASAAAKLTWYSFVLRDIGAFLAQPPTWFSDNISTLHHSYQSSPSQNTLKLTIILL